MKKKKVILTSIIVMVIMMLSIGIKVSFYEPSKINAVIASKVFKTPANTAFKDDNFYKCVVDAYNSTNNASVAYTTKLTDAQLKTITRLNCENYDQPDTKKISDVTGIEKLLNLKWVYLDHNNIVKMDLSSNVNLEFLRAGSNKITSINVSNSKNLYTLSLDYNNINSIDVSNNVNLENLNLFKNSLTTIDVSKNTKLNTFDASYNSLNSIDVSKNVNLVYLGLDTNKINSIDVSKNTKLETLYLGYNNLNTINLNNNIYITVLGLRKNNMSSINLDKLVNLTELNLSENNLSAINLVNNKKITWLDLSSNSLEFLDLSKNDKIETFILDGAFKIIEKVSYINQAITYTNPNLIKFPNGESTSLKSISYRYSGLSINNNTVTSSESGEYELQLEISETFSNSTFTIGSKLYVEKAKSDKYIINEEYDFIYIGFLQDAASIIKNISLKHSEAILTDYKTIEITHDGKKLREFDVIEIEGGYDPNKEFLYNYDEIKNPLIVTKPASAVKNDSSNKVVVKYNDIVLDTFDFVELRYNGELLEKEQNILVGENTIGSFLYNLKCVNCEAKILRNNDYITSGSFEINDKLVMLYKGEIIASYNLIHKTTGVSFDKDEVSIGLQRNTTIQLNVTVTPSYAAYKDVTYTSSNPNVATVDSNGLVTSKGLGTAVITVTNFDGYTDTIIINVINITFYNLIYKTDEKTYTFSYAEGDSITLKSDLVKTGYTLTGYKYNGNIYKLTDKITMPTNDITLTAIWTANSYTISYDVVTTTKTVTYNSTYGELPTPSKTGYKFKGWYLENTYNTLVTSTTKVATANNHKLYAKWEANKYTLSYDVLTTTKSVTYNSTYGDLPTPSKTGYTFKGWYLENTYNTLVTSTTKVATANNHKLYAKWEANSYTLSYDVLTTTKSVTYNSTYGDLPTPSKTGYTFKGWYLENTYNTLVTSTSKVTKNSNHMLYGKWELIKPDITKTSDYKVNNGMVSNIKQKTEIKDLKLGLESHYSVKVQDKNKKDKTSGKMATNDKVKIYLDNILVDEYTVVIKGDVTGTGESTVSDVAKLYQYLKEKITMEDCYKEAGNVYSDDNEIKINDIAKLYQFIKGKIKTLD